MAAKRIKTTAKAKLNRNGFRPSSRALPPEQCAQRDRFVDGLCKGLSRHEAARYAGVNAKSAGHTSRQLWLDPYVQESFSRLREKLSDAQLVTRNELVLNLKSIAFDDFVHAQHRITASVAIAKIMGFEAAEKHDIRVSHVMAVPVVGNPAQWELSALGAQRQLRDTCLLEDSAQVIDATAVESDGRLT